MSTKAIETYLQTAYDDKHLAMLLAHAESGKLAYFSCCCFAGIPTADHELQGENREVSNAHWASRFPTGGWAASHAFNRLSRTRDEEEANTARRAKLIPLIKAEMSRRAELARG